MTSMHAARSSKSPYLPIRLCAETTCFRREAGAAGRDTRGLLRVHEFDKVELFAYCTPDQHADAFADILARAEGLLRELASPTALLDLCTGDLGTSSTRTIDLEVYSPGRRPLARGLLGQLVPRLPGAARQRALPHGETVRPRSCTR